MPAIEPAAAIILAGGRGSRLGGALPKAAVPLAGQTLLERAVATARGVAQDIVIAAPSDLPLPTTSARRVDDPPDSGGPLGGVLAGMRELAASARTVVVLGVDFPLVQSQTLQWLRASLGSARAIVPAPGGTWQPLVAVYAAEARPVFERQWSAGVRSIMQALREVEPRVVEDAEIERLERGVGQFLNVNTPEDLAIAEERISGGSFDP